MGGHLEELHMTLREQLGREASPTVAVIDSQPDAEGGRKRGGFDGEVGYDAGKKVKGRRIPPLSTPKACRYGPSFIPSASRTAPSTSSGDAALVLDKIRNRFPWLELV